MIVLKRIFFLSIFCLFLLSCEDEFLVNKYIIDNPTDEKIEVYIGNNKYVIKPKKYIIAKLDGRLVLSTKVNGEFIVEDEPFEITYPSGMINPTKSEYVVYDIPYESNYKVFNGFSNYEEDLKKPDAEEKMNEGTMPRPAPVVTNDIFIEDVTFGLGNVNKKVPKVKKASRLNYSFLRKIFRMEDFLKFADEFQ